MFRWNYSVHLSVHVPHFHQRAFGLVPLNPAATCILTLDVFPLRTELLDVGGLSTDDNGHSRFVHGVLCSTWSDDPVERTAGQCARQLNRGGTTGGNVVVLSVPSRTFAKGNAKISVETSRWKPCEHRCVMHWVISRQMKSHLKQGHSCLAQPRIYYDFAKKKKVARHENI